jgi:hypothetical protein
MLQECHRCPHKPGVGLSWKTWSASSILASPDASVGPSSVASIRTPAGTTLPFTGVVVAASRDLCEQGAPPPSKDDEYFLVAHFKRIDFAQSDASFCVRLSRLPGPFRPYLVARRPRLQSLMSHSKLRGNSMSRATFHGSNSSILIRIWREHSQKRGEGKINHEKHETHERKIK